MPDHRDDARYSHQKMLRLEFSEERVYYGVSRDVSVAGLFFIPEGEEVEVEVGETGYLQLTTGEDVHRFSCQVMRVTAEGLALQITDYPARFGVAISHDLFHSMLTRMRDRQ